MKIAVIGTGYVGLVAGACFAESGNDVVCIDKDAAKVRMLRRGKMPIYEPGLEELVRRNRQEGRLTFTTTLPKAVRDSAIIFIAVGTPQGEDGSADLQHVLTVARDIAKAMNGYKVIVNKSTVPVGTSAKVRDVIRRETTHPFSVVSNPEFLKQGAAIEDFMKPDRVVIGVESEHAKSVMGELYAPFVRTGKPVIFMDIPSAEMTKYAANGMLATRISFMNEIASLCEKVGANVDLVRHGLGSDSRIGPSFLFPGPGYGGSCFPKDVKALVKAGRAAGVPLHVLEGVEATNERQKHRLGEKLRAVLGDSLDGARIAVWGLAFKPQTDDMREAPSLVLIEDALAGGATICAHDPVAMKEARRILGDRIEYAETNYDALPGADALVVVTDWNEYRHPDFERVRTLLKRPVVIDGRNLYDPEKMESLGIVYHSIGRKPTANVAALTG